jgi:prepilin-type N-terminal cleavage/methylation domain-containing protein
MKKGFTPHFLWNKKKNHLKILKKGAGFTLIEMMVAIVILVVIFSIASPFLISFSNNQETESTVEELVSVLRQAQEKSIIAENDASWGIDFSVARKYLLINNLSAIKEEYQLPESVKLETNNKTIFFSKLSGSPNQATEIVLTGINKRYKIEINLIGRVDFYKLNQ